MKNTQEIVCNRTADRLTRRAAALGLDVSVRVASDRTTRKTWYSIGLSTNMGWHQCAGYKYAAIVSADLDARVANKAKTGKK